MMRKAVNKRDLDTLLNAIASIADENAARSCWWNVVVPMAMGNNGVGEALMSHADAIAKSIIKEDLAETAKKQKRAYVRRAVVEA